VQKQRFCPNVLFFAAPEAILKIFQRNVNSILPLNQMELASISSSFEQLCIK